MARKGIKLTVRMSEEDAAQIANAARSKSYGSPTAFIRAAIQHELSDRSELSDAEQRIASSFDRLSRDVFRVGRGQQALFALVDTLTKTILTCVPESRADPRRQAIARGKERYDVLMKTAGRAMVGEARAAISIWSTMTRKDDEREFRLRPTKPRVRISHGSRRLLKGRWLGGFQR